MVDPGWGVAAAFHLGNEFLVLLCCDQNRWRDSRAAMGLAAVPAQCVFACLLCPCDPSWVCHCAHLSKAPLCQELPHSGGSRVLSLLTTPSIPVTPGQSRPPFPLSPLLSFTLALLHLLCPLSRMFVLLYFIGWLQNLLPTLKGNCYKYLCVNSAVT